jgi:hypothetical protein
MRLNTPTLARPLKKGGRKKKTQFYALARLGGHIGVISISL